MAASVESPRFAIPSLLCLLCSSSHKSSWLLRSVYRTAPPPPPRPALPRPLIPVPFDYCFRTLPVAPDRSASPSPAESEFLTQWSLRLPVYFSSFGSWTRVLFCFFFKSVRDAVPHFGLGKTVSDHLPAWMTVPSSLKMLPVFYT